MGTRICHGAANPSKAIASGYYIPEPGKSVSDLIAGRIALRPASTHLILGGIGSSKTTQLLVAFDKLNGLLGNSCIKYIDVSLSTNIAKIAPGVLVAIVGVNLANLMAGSEESTVKKSIDVIHRLAYGYSEIRQRDYLSELTTRNPTSLSAMAARIGS